MNSSALVSNITERLHLITDIDILNTINQILEIKDDLPDIPDSPTNPASPDAPRWRKIANLGYFASKRWMRNNNIMAFNYDIIGRLGGWQTNTIYVYRNTPVYQVVNLINKEELNRMNEYGRFEYPELMILYRDGNKISKMTKLVNEPIYTALIGNIYEMARRMTGVNVFTGHFYMTGLDEPNQYNSDMGGMYIKGDDE